MCIRDSFPAVGAMKSALAVAERIVATTTFRADRLAEGLDAGHLDATALAEYLVNKGVPFRTAHQVVGALVGRLGAEVRSLAELPLQTLREASDRFGPDVYDFVGAANVVKHYAPEGASGAKQLRKQLAFWRKRLA